MPAAGYKESADVRIPTLIRDQIRFSQPLAPVNAHEMCSEKRKPAPVCTIDPERPAEDLRECPLSVRGILQRSQPANPWLYSARLKPVKADLSKHAAN
mmetsp:Transcript_5619/g.17283  ORF Transcript_5619/g.17283 Transcript_5619/m.17283 type:complete len:98 (-) Transcript_5619:121-414(-)